MRLLAITPPASVMPTLEPGLVRVWADAGVLELGLAVLLREPRAPATQVLAAPRLLGLREALAERGIPTLVSVDPHVGEHQRIATIAAIVAARPTIVGVQLRGDPSPQLCARWRAGFAGTGLEILGRSCHGLDPDPTPSPVDYSCVAPVFGPNTAQAGVIKHAIGLEAVRRWASVVPRVFALGGVDPDRAAACLAAGVTGIAGISLFFGQSAVAQQHLRALRQVFARPSADLDPDLDLAPDDHVQPRPRP